jgi:hypothetical protein
MATIEELEERPFWSWPDIPPHRAQLKLRLGYRYGVDCVYNPHLHDDFYYYE